MLSSGVEYKFQKDLENWKTMEDDAQLKIFLKLNPSYKNVDNFFFFVYWFKIFSISYIRPVTFLFMLIWISNQTRFQIELNFTLFEIESYINFYQNICQLKSELICNMWYRFMIVINQNLIVFTIFRLNWNQTVVRLVPNQWEVCDYNPNLVSSNKIQQEISLCSHQKAEEKRSL